MGMTGGQRLRTAVACGMVKVDADILEKYGDETCTFMGNYVALFNNQYLHRIVLPNVERVDHKNRDKYDCRRDNLREATRSQNQANIPSINKTGYRGVYAFKGGFATRIKHNKKAIHIGYFRDKIIAAKAYDLKAKELYGCFATLNFPGSNL